jgi:hypothetical protein
MIKYCVHFLDHGGNIRGVDYFEAKDDQAAIEHARDRLASGFGAGHEVWRGDTRIHFEPYGAE